MYKVVGGEGGRGEERGGGGRRGDTHLGTSSALYSISLTNKRAHTHTHTHTH